MARALGKMAHYVCGKRLLIYLRRWLVHSIGSYYGLRTWSVTVGDPARREAYVGIKQMRTGNRPVSAGGELPRPLWNMV